MELADTLVAHFDVVELLTRLADRCVNVLDVCAAGLMLVAGWHLRVMAASSEAMRSWNCSSCSRRKGLAWTVTAAASP